MNSHEQAGYSTPPSITKKKVFIQLQCAPSSRKGQSTLDTSTDKKIACCEENCYEKPADSEFSQELFKKLLNECDIPLKESIKEHSTLKEIPYKTLSNRSIEFVALFNARDKKILELFVIDLPRALMRVLTLAMEIFQYRSSSMYEFDLEHGFMDDRLLVREICNREDRANKRRMCGTG